MDQPNAIFPGVDYGLLLGFPAEPSDQGFVGFLFLLLRAEGKGGIPVGMGQGQERRKQRHHLLQASSVIARSPFDYTIRSAHLCLRHWGRQREVKHWASATTVETEAD